MDWMRKIIFYCLLCWTAGNLMAAEGHWLTSLPAAQAQAQQAGKLVLLNFTGTDWCPACMKMEREIFSKPEFLAYAKTNLVLVLVDFPLDKPQSKQLQAANDALQEKYKVDGYPTLLVTKPDGRPVWQQDGYPPGGLAGLLAKLDELRKK
jgi:protein disulfide-isomerase